MIDRAESLPRRLALMGGAAILAMLLIGVPTTGAQTPAATPAPAPADFATLGFPTVAASIDYVPGSGTSVSAGGMTVQLPANFYKGPAKLELLTGLPSTFAAAAGGRTVLFAWAFRATDSTTNQLIGSFGSPVQCSYTADAVGADTVVLNTSPASPPVVTVNGTAPTISGHTMSHAFGGASAGWLVANPAASAQPSAGRAAVQAPTNAGAGSAAPATLPSTGTGGLLDRPAAMQMPLALAAAVAGLFILAAGSISARRRVQR
jgi:hypothetical protein